jgi:sugar O-acyltransferase (sialic acid O-acetyltransferase NeuD family)
MKRTLIVFGSETAEEIVCAARESYAEEFDSIKKFRFDDSLDRDVDFLATIKDATFCKFIVGITDVRLKPKVVEFAESKGMKPVSIIHSTAYVAPSATIGEGTFVAPQAVVSVNAKVGAHSIIHIHSSIGHDSSISQFCAVLPGARISGNVTLEDGVVIGSGSFVFQGVRIGRRAQVDALTYVRQDLIANRTISCRSTHRR